MALTITGIQEAQRANLTLVRNMHPTGAMGRMVQNATVTAHRYAVYTTHYQTGALRAAHRIDLRGNQGVISIDQTAVNPKGQRPSIYGPQEHARGGTHAFYRRTVDERGMSISRASAYGFMKEIR